MKMNNPYQLFQKIISVQSSKKYAYKTVFFDITTLKNNLRGFLTTAGTLHQRHSNDKDQEEMTPDCKNPSSRQIPFEERCKVCELPIKDCNNPFHKKFF